ncbi:MAG TPA: D-alanyl-D-alanine carboxypeptidase family protein [Ktedonobacterales bacterium]
MAARLIPVTALVSLICLALVACGSAAKSSIRVSALARHAAVPAIHTNAASAPPALTARAAELYNLSTGKTMLSVNTNAEMPMASTTKIMTAIVALTYGKLDQPITVGADAVAVDSQGASIAGLREGETLSLRELLYCLMLPSGDDAAIAIADGVGGSQAGFVALMNLEAGLLGLSHTHYANAHGLDQNGHFTSAGDLVRLAIYAIGSPTFAQIVRTPTRTLPSTSTHHTFMLTNTNELLPGEPYAYPGALGVKTGYTGGAGYCLVFMAIRPQGALIGVVLGEPLPAERFTDPTKLLNWGYAQLEAPAAPGATPTVTATTSSGA